MAASSTSFDHDHGPNAAVTRQGRARVLLPLPLAGAYDYRVPEGMRVGLGEFVEVPLGGRAVAGVVWDPKAEDAAAIDDGRLKDVSARFEVPPMTAATRRFIEWVADYTLAPPGAVLRMAMSVPAALLPPRPRLVCTLADSAPDPAAPLDADRHLTPARRRVLRELSDGPARELGDLARAAGVGTSVVRAMMSLGWVAEVALPEGARLRPIEVDREGLPLSDDQRAAAEALMAAVAAQRFSVSVLDGVTGSGKTEVYFESLAAAIRAGRQALVLLPEIALSAQWLSRFERRFGVRPAVWHSELSGNERRATWRDLAFGRARLVVGARSALFLPLAELGLIVVDEEHEVAFKQEEGVMYHARDMAVVRARLGELPIALVSATPSLETIANIERGRYRRLHLPDRPGSATLPTISLVDLRRFPPPRRAAMSPILREAVIETLAAKEQVLLYLNRRGYAPLTLCRSCGHRLQCPNCTAWLVEHRLAGRLICHHCGFSRPPPRQCPECQAADSFAACGPGVERLAEEVAVLFPEARFAIMTSDTVSGPASAEAFIARMVAREIDLLIGTQIVAKGHHFPDLTLVGVIDADLGLTGGDLRAAERTYQLLHHVAGRAGRAERPGRVLLQTYVPEHPVMRALARHDRDGFLAAESAERRRFGLPPFGRLAALIVSGRDERQVEGVARELAAKAPRDQALRVLGPAPAPLAVLRGRHRRRLLLKADRGVDVQATLRDWLTRVSAPGPVRIQVDVDPYSFA